MVGGTPKPFACTSEGCTMTFTNEDHLNVHQRKHEMVLNLGGKSSNIVADQTPTPTRFLRNCEEVGLFQDLQNVNPFEETFRRAVELVKTGSLPLPIIPDDDTLHTPHVFPHLPVENVSCIYSMQNTKNIKMSENIIIRNIDIETMETNTNEKILSSSDKNETILTLNTNNDSPDHVYALSINSEKNPSILITNTEESHEDNLSSKNCKTNKQHLNFHNGKVNRTKNRKYSNGININIISDNKSNNNISTKTKLQQVLLQNKKQLKSVENKCNTAPQSVIVLQGVPLVPVLQTKELTILPKTENITVPIKNNFAPSTIINKNAKSVISNNSKSRKSHHETRKLDLLERNRAAALRCRERKKVWIGTLEDKFNIVCKEKQDLQKEVTNLRNEIVHLKTLLLAHKDCPVTKAMNMGQNIPIGPPQIVTITAPETDKDNENENITDRSNSSSRNSESELKIFKTNGEFFEIVKNLSIGTQSKTSVIVLND